MLVCLWIARADACNVPVFRYAMERWQTEEYAVIVFHQGSLSASEQLWVGTLQPTNPAAPLNVAVRLVDLAEPLAEPLRTFWQQQTNAAPPWVVLLAPQSDTNTPPVWAGPLDENSARALADSPARREIAHRLLKGESAVWVFLESGVLAQDENALDVLSDALKEAAKTIELPRLEADDPQMRSPLPLRVQFSVVRVSRQNPLEHIFIATLLHGLDRLAELPRPTAFPVFGRGRMLAALAGKDLSAPIIGQACSFICGMCSCEVKELNPGRDLLLAADWDAFFEGSTVMPPALPLLTGLSQVSTAALVRTPTAVATNAPAAVGSGGRLLQNLLYVLGLGIVALVLGTWLLKSKTGKSQP